MSLRDAIARVAAGDELPPELLEGAFGEIADGRATPAQIAGLLIGLRVKGETPSEIAAVARALRARAQQAPLPDPRTVDTCGTGGDASGTFNISTTVAFVVAGAGVPVAKHGNRAATSRSGSFDLLETLGVRVDLPVEDSARILREVGIAGFFARVAHPAMRHVAPVRQELGVRTLMNCVGPLLNPVGARYQLVGVYSEALVDTLARALGELGAKRALVVHGSDGLDEITLTGTSRAALWNGSSVEAMEIDPAAYGLATCSPGALAGGTPQENAAILREVLAGKAGPRRDIVLLNAAAALFAAGAVADLGAGLEPAAASIDEGRARERLAALVAATQRASPAEGATE